MKISDKVGMSPGNLLKGSDVVALRKQRIGGVILQARESPPGFGAPFILDFDTVVAKNAKGDISSWPCNMTQARVLGHMIGNDTESWAGWGIVLKVVSQNNPNLKTEVPSLEVEKVVHPSEVKKTRKTKATISKNATPEGTSDEPFSF